MGGRRSDADGRPERPLNETPGHPIVTAEWLGAAPDAPTVLVYCHYDVQPEDPSTVDPSTVRASLRRRQGLRAWLGGDKGQLFMHLRRPRRTSAEAMRRLPVNLRFLFEGEEEIGSDHLDAFLEEQRELLKADVVVVSDTAFFAHEVPSLGYGLRGLAYVELHGSGPRQDLHSGQFCGAVANPAVVLVEMLASLHDDQRRVTIPGFYDGFAPDR